MEDILAILGIFFFCPLLGFVVFSNTGRELTGALADRIRGGASTEGALRDEVEHLRADVEDLRAQLGETQERLDFAERMLAAPRDGGGPIASKEG
ncbi:MAG: hypothetical protein NW201_04375 [Gemmatimonadales bacterium]|nr:hypothetical protein [Gemmatimonadales bacterium]